MIKTRFAISALILLAFAAGCGGAKFTEEKTVLTAISSAMETFANSVNSAETPDALAGILGTFSGQLEKFLPQMKKITADHPEWQTAPPKELKEEFAKFNHASQQFQGAMPKLMQFASEYGDNPALNSAVEKFQQLVSQL
jgi:polyhydroxyalkanoate synthesis regulator protein